MIYLLFLPPTHNYLAGEKLAGDKGVVPGLQPTDACLFLIAASGVVWGLFIDPWNQTI